MYGSGADGSAVDVSRARFPRSCAMSFTQTRSPWPLARGNGKARRCSTSVAPVGLYSSYLSEAPVLWGSLPTASGSCSPFGLMANATGGMPFSVLQRRDSSRRSARPITPLRGGPGWIGEPTKKPARREPCGLVICKGVFAHRFHVLPDSPPGDVYRDERGRDCWRLRSRHAVYLSLCRPQPSSAPSSA